MTRHWLMKSEPAECSIDDLARAPNQTLPWVGVRNYQARNFLRDTMAVGDGVLFYHSSCPQPGIAGLATIAGPASPDLTQFDPTSPYYDAKSQRELPRWLQIDVTLMRKTRLLSLQELRNETRLIDMQVLARGNRLSVTPVSPDHWQIVLTLLDA